jgi:hypothetical protein
MAELDTKLSPSWVNVQLAMVEKRAATINAQWEPEAEETLSGDGIYSKGSPNLLLVGNDSPYIYALTRQPMCDGETWACALLDAPDSPQFASDGGTGLAAGAQTDEVAVHQLDWDHLLRPLWGQATRLEQHLKAWERLDAEAEEKVGRFDAFLPIVQQVDEQFAMIGLELGTLRDAKTAATCCVIWESNCKAGKAASTRS